MTPGRAPWRRKGAPGVAALPFTAVVRRAARKEHWQQRGSTAPLQQWAHPQTSRGPNLCHAALWAPNSIITERYACATCDVSPAAYTDARAPSTVVVALMCRGQATRSIPSARCLSPTGINKISRVVLALRRLVSQGNWANVGRGGHATARVTRRQGNRLQRPGTAGIVTASQ